MSTKVNYLFLGTSVVLNYEGKTVTLQAGEGAFPKVAALIKAGKEDEIPALLASLTFTGDKDLKLVDGIVYLDGEVVPSVLNKRIVDYMEAGIPFDSLVAFARKLRGNPSLNSRKQLYSFLEHNGHPITKDGNFIAYRGVTEDFKDCHTRTFDNSVGSVCEMPRSEVDDNPNNTCSNGLHVACHDYARSFGRVLVEVEVDPQDVVCVPTDYNGTKMRVCRFKVVAVGEKMIEAPYYGDDFESDSMEDEDYCSECDSDSTSCYCW